MQSQTLTFDRVYDIRRLRASRSRTKHTEFAFATASATKDMVGVPGWPVIEDGMSVTVLMRNADEWTTLLGWVDHTHEQIAGPFPREYLNAAVFLTTLSVVWICLAVWFVTPPERSGSIAFLAVVSGIWIAMTTAAWIVWWRQRRIMNTLRSLAR